MSTLFWLILPRDKWRNHNLTPVYSYTRAELLSLRAKTSLLNLSIVDRLRDLSIGYHSPRRHRSGEGGGAHVWVMDDILESLFYEKKFYIVLLFHKVQNSIFQHWTIRLHIFIYSKITKIFATCGRLRVCSSGFWNIRDHRFSRILPFNWYRPPHFYGHQLSPPDVLHLSTDFSCHYPRQRTGYNSLIKETCPGVGWETLTFKMEMRWSGL